MIKSQCLGFLNTSPLWEKKQFDIEQFDFPRLDLSAFEPKTIPDNIRLGHQIEYVFQQLVEYSEDHKVVLYNLPIREPKRTLGEIDFILSDKKQKQLIHIELTYKFYLIDPEISDPIHSLIGPNRRDTFFKKMQKIKNVQFPLLHTLEGTKALQSRHIDHSQIEHQCCFKAQLFQAFDTNELKLGELNKACLAGYWLRLDDLNQARFTEAVFYIPTKSEWVIQPNDQVAWKSHSEIIAVIRQSILQERSPFVWLKNLKGEFEKLFVVWW